MLARPGSSPSRLSFVFPALLTIACLWMVPANAQIPPDRNLQPEPTAPAAPGDPVAPAVPGEAEVPPPLPPNTVIRMLSDGRTVMIGPSQYATEFRMQATVMNPDGTRRRLEDGLHKLDDGTQFRVRRGSIIDGR